MFYTVVHHRLALLRRNRLFEHRIGKEYYDQVVGRRLSTYNIIAAIESSKQVNPLKIYLCM